MPDSLFCPHCLSVLQSSPQAMVRCDACRLIVGPGRGLTAEQAKHSDVPISASSGMLRNSAVRENHEPGDPEQVLAALRRAAEQLGCRVERLRLADYQHLSQADTAFPSVAEVLATFPLWKDARAQAGVQTVPD